MITCQHARQLFDRHLDDELSPSLQAELHAHVIQCNPCQNQLALYEACGDVIRLDAHEPRPSSSFADRVMAGRRQQVAATAAKRPVVARRMVWRIGGPMAAAAAIVLAVMIGVFASHRGPDHATVIAGDTAAVPKAVQANLLNLTGRELDAKSAAELARTPEMKTLPFLEDLVRPLAAGVEGTAENTRQSYQDLRTLVRVVLAGQTERLAAEYSNKHPELSQQDVKRVINDLDILPKPLEPLPDLPASDATSSDSKAAPDAPL